MVNISCSCLAFTSTCCEVNDVIDSPLATSYSLRHSRLRHQSRHLMTSFPDRPVVWSSSTSSYIIHDIIMVIDIDNRTSRGYQRYGYAVSSQQMNNHRIIFVTVVILIFIIIIRATATISSSWSLLSLLLMLLFFLSIFYHSGLSDAKLLHCL